MRIEYDYQKTYVTTIERAVGTTTDLNVRGALPQPAPDDLNAIWLAPNGNDGNLGTEAAPKLTLSGAIAALTVAKATVHIFRNGWGGDLLFNETTFSTLPALRNIQVEESETSEINYDGATLAGNAPLTLSGTNIINGAFLSIKDLQISGSNYGIIRINGNVVTISNCKFRHQGFLDANGDYQYEPCISMFNQSSVTLEYSVFQGQTGISSTDLASYDSINNILIYDIRPSVRFNDTSGGISIEASGAGPQGTVNINRNIFANYKFTQNSTSLNYVSTPPIALVGTGGVSPAPGMTINIDNCHIYDSTIPLTIDFVNWQFLTINMDYNHLGSELAFRIARGNVSANVTITNNNFLDPDLPPLLVDGNDFSTNLDIDSARLQFEGKSTPDGSGKYFLDSPLVGAGSTLPGAVIRSFRNTVWGGGSVGDITEAPDGTLYIHVQNQNRVRHTTAYGIPISDWLTTGFDAAANSTQGMDYDYGTDTLWLCDRNTDKVYNVTLAGTLITSFSKNVFDVGANDMTGICVDRQNQTLWVCDRTTDKVYNIQRNGTLITSYLTSIIKAGLTFPIGIACDIDSTLWLVDSTADEVHNFQKDGTPISDFSINTYSQIATGISISNNPNRLWIIDDTGGAQAVYYINKNGIVDINPWDEFTLLASTAYNKSMNIDWPPKALKIENRYVGSVNNIDIRGNLHTDYDSERRVFSFDFGDDIHISNIQAKELRDIIADNGSKRFYPLGLGSNMFDPVAPSSGIFTSSDNTMSPTSAGGNPMVPGHWRGFWITINSNDYYINDNDDSKLYLIDKDSVGFPSDDLHGFIVQYILVNIEKNTYILNQSGFTEFLKGGQWRESTEDVRNYDYTIDSLELHEIEDNEANI